MKIKNNTTYKQNKRQKSHDHSIVGEKAFDNSPFQHPFVIKSFKELGMEEIYLNITKAIYDKPIANIILNGEELKPHPLKSGMRQGVHSHHPYSI
jgi:hypothetical protein